MNQENDSINPNAGEFILSQLEQFGSNLKRKHEVTFWLYFPSEASARNAARRAENAGLKPDVSPRWRSRAIRS